MNPLIFVPNFRPLVPFLPVKKFVVGAKISHCPGKFPSGGHISVSPTYCLPMITLGNNDFAVLDISPDSTLLGSNFSAILGF